MDARPTQPAGMSWMIVDPQRRATGIVAPAGRADNDIVYITHFAAGVVRTEALLGLDDRRAVVAIHLCL